MYFDPRKPGKFIYPSINMGFLYQPFYIGKGSGDRWKHHLWNLSTNDCNPYKQRKINAIRKKLQIDPYISIVKRFEQAQKAYSYEEKLIQLIGRSNNKSGPLTNLDDGGGEDATCKKAYWTKARRKQRSLDNKGSNNPMYGKTVYEVWVTKYGVEEANKRKEKESKRKREIGLLRNISGSNNPMYGRCGASNPNYKHVNTTKLLYLVRQNHSRKFIAKAMSISIDKLASEFNRLFNTRSIKEVRKILNEGTDL